MKAVLISIQPKYCELIASGKKTIEVRKTYPKIERPFKCYIYQTKKWWIYKLLPWLAARKQKVIGEFVCRGIMRPNNNLSRMAKGSLLTEKELFEYSNGKELYGWRISDLKIYDKPKELSEFRKPCVDKYEYCQGCQYGHIILQPDEEEYALYHGGYYDTFETICLNGVTRPPQSWCYVEE